MKSLVLRSSPGAPPALDELDFFKIPNKNNIPKNALIMSRPRPLMRAEQLALDRGPESQDSQAILDALKAEFGAAAVRTPTGQGP